MVDGVQRRVYEVDLVNETVKGLQAFIGELAAERGGPALPVVIVSGPYELREYYNQTNQATTGSLPIIALMVVGFGDSIPMGIGNYGKQALYNGIQLGQSTDGQDLLIFHGYQIGLECQVRVIAQTLTDVISFAARWLYRQREMQFKLRMNGLSGGIYIKVNMSENLAIPQMDVSEVGNLYTFETQLTASTYVGEIEIIPKTRSINFSMGLADVRGDVITSTVTDDVITGH